MKPRKKRAKKLLAFYLILVLLVSFGYWRTTQAAAMDTISDVMTRLQVSPATSSHDITFDLYSTTTFDAGETITIDFGEDDSKFTVDGSGSLVADFDFNDGTERTIVDVDGSCVGHSGANEMVVGINDSTGVVTFTACGSFTSSGSGATVNIEYGTAAGGTNRVTNPTVADDYVVNIAGTVGDTGAFAVAILTDDTVDVSVTIDPYLTFTITDTTVSLSATNSTTTGFDFNTMAAYTNADGGYTITYNGATLSGGGNSIDAMTSETTSSTNTEQFGINLMNNATPNVGADPTGGIGAAGGDYNDADSFMFTPSTTTALASAAGPSASTTYTVSYIANVAATTEAGTYSTTITYICTATF